MEIKLLNKLDYTFNVTEKINFFHQLISTNNCYIKNTRMIDVNAPDLTAKIINPQCQGNSQSMKNSRVAVTNASGGCSTATESVMRSANTPSLRGRASSPLSPRVLLMTDRLQGANAEHHTERHKRVTTGSAGNVIYNQQHEKSLHLSLPASVRTQEITAQQHERVFSGQPERLLSRVEQLRKISGQPLTLLKYPVSRQRNNISPVCHQQVTETLSANKIPPQPLAEANRFIPDISELQSPRLVMKIIAQQKNPVFRFAGQPETADKPTISEKVKLNFARNEYKRLISSAIQLGCRLEEKKTVLNDCMSSLKRSEYLVRKLLYKKSLQKKIL